jgi:hypothetical protein
VKPLHVLLLITAGSLLACAPVQARGRQETHWSFPAKSLVELTTVTAICVVEQGVGDRIRVEITPPAASAELIVPSYMELTDTLILNESVEPSAAASRAARWVIRVPPHVRVRFRSTSGSLTVGPAELTVVGETVSGNIHVEGVTGELQLSTRTGGIEARRVVLTGESGFGSETGNLSISLGRAPTASLFLYTKSGAAVLDCGKAPLRGTFHLEAREPEGKILSVPPFDRVEIVDRSGTKFRVGTVGNGEDLPLVRILTATGAATLRAR